MKKLSVYAALALSAGVILGGADRAVAVSVGFGTTTDINSCTDADPCVLSGASDPTYLTIPGIDIFWATFSGVSNQTVSWDMTAAVDMDVVVSPNGPVSTSIGGGLAAYNFLAGQTQTVDLAFATTPLTLNLLTVSGSDSGDASSLFTTGGGTGFAFDMAGGSLGAPMVTGGTGGTGTGGTGGGSGGTGGGTGVSPVPVPAAGWLLLAALGGLAAARRKTRV